MTVQTDGELVGGSWDVGERRNLKAVGNVRIFLTARLLLMYSLTTGAVRG